MIRITVNNETHEVASNTSLNQLVEHLQIESNGIAVAINDSIISQSLWSDTFLVPQDQVLIITATPGG